MSDSLQFDYTIVGHVSRDVLPDGSSRAGGTALYGALQASRLGLRTLIHTRGVPHEVESLLRPHRDEFELVIEPAGETTTLLTTGAGSTRSQRLLAWAGPIESGGQAGGSILHLAPIAGELSTAWPRHKGFLGLTPQGLVRDWSRAGAEVPATAADPFAGLAERCDAIVLSVQERTACSALISAVDRGGGLVAVTAGAGSTRLRYPGGEEQELAVTALDRPADDIGAGDVYASALFIALSQGETPIAAATFAAAAAAERMTGVGAQAVAGRAAIEARLERTDGEP